MAVNRLSNRRVKPRPAQLSAGYKRLLQMTAVFLSKTEISIKQRLSFILIE